MDKHETDTAYSVHHEPVTPVSVTQKEQKNDIDAEKGDELSSYATEPPIQIDDETNKKLFWAINKRVLVCMLGTYFCQSLDKGTIGFASVQGIREDAHLVGSQFNWLGTALYLGVLVGEYPTNYLLQKLPVGKYLAANIFLWGAVVSTAAAANSFPGLLVGRLLLGIFESCVQPAFVILTSMWYTRKEQVLLLSLWYCMSGVQLMVGGIIAWGVSHFKGGVFKSWQLLFLLLGLATVIWSAFVGWWLPDSPIKAKCFTHEQKRLMAERVRANETGIENKTWKRYQMIEALTDPVIWCYALLSLTSTLIIGGLGVFSNLIISSFGFSYLQTQLLNIAQGAVNILVIVGAAWCATKSKNTTLIMHIWCLPAIAGTAVIFAIPPTSTNKVGLLIAFYATQFFLAQGNLSFSLISRNVAGRTKKTTALSVNFIFWAVGNLSAPQIFQEPDAPRYRNGFTVHFVLYGLFNVVLVATRFFIVRRNKAKQLAATTRGDGTVEHLHAFDDLTDKENPDFRYDI
ncbi:major facilitator superfamily domain-containing protein [Nemania abortiva]|nr:major facilitator superfamily domain-containing protein [Nemania abortiva]